MNGSMANWVKHAKDTASAVDEGKSLADEVLRSAVETEAAGERLAAHTAAVAAHTNRVADLCSLLRTLANQTDLLAVNAAAEGARGRSSHQEQVAHTARKLRRIAESALTAATDFEQLDGELRAGAAAAVLAAEEASKSARATAELARTATTAAARQQMLATSTCVALTRGTVSPD